RGVTTEYNRSTTDACNRIQPAGTRDNSDSRASRSVTRIPIRTPRTSKATPAAQPRRSILSSQVDFQLRVGRRVCSPYLLIFLDAYRINVPRICDILFTTLILLRNQNRHDWLRHAPISGANQEPLGMGMHSWGAEMSARAADISAHGGLEPLSRIR